MKIRLWIPLLLIIILLNGCNQVDNTNGRPKVDFQTLNLSKTEHPELDFGVSSHDGEKVIRDFVITPEGNLLILELSDKVYEYSPKGELLEVHDFKFEEKGLTAYMLTIDNKRNFYFVDGHNSLIIKGKKNKIINTASIGEESLIGESELIKNISALEENILIIEGVSPVDLLTYTYTLDVSGDKAISVNEPEIGVIIGNSLSYKNELITNEEGEITNGTSITIYENKKEKSKFHIYSKDNFIVGLNICGVTEDGNYLARIHEIRSDTNMYQDTFVILDNQGKVASICTGEIKEDDIIRGYNDNTFVFRFNDKGATIFPMLELFTISEEESWFK